MFNCVSCHSYQTETGDGRYGLNGDWSMRVEDKKRENTQRIVALGMQLMPVDQLSNQEFDLIVGTQIAFSSSEEIAHLQEFWDLYFSIPGRLRRYSVPDSSQPFEQQARDYHWAYGFSPANEITDLFLPYGINEPESFTGLSVM